MKKYHRFHRSIVCAILMLMAASLAGANPDDECINATDIVLDYLDINASNCSLTNDGLDYSECMGTFFTGFDGFYRYFNNTGSNVEVQICATDLTTMTYLGVGVYDDCPSTGTATCIASMGAETLNSCLTVCIENTKTYYILIDNQAPPLCTPAFTFSVTNTLNSCLVAPDIDECIEAFPIPLPGSGIVDYATENIQTAMSAFGSGNCYTPEVGGYFDQWYVLDIPVGFAGFLSIHGCHSPMDDTQMSTWQSRDDTCSGLFTELQPAAGEITCGENNGVDFGCGSKFIKGDLTAGIKLNLATRQGDRIYILYHSAQGSYRGTQIITVDYTETTPLGVDLLSFEAAKISKGVQLLWKTAAEIDVLGYLLSRQQYIGKNLLSPPEEITPSIILATGGASAGAAYEFIDSQVTPATTYRYTLFVVESSGSSKTMGTCEVALRDHETIQKGK